jgi:3-deoxy-D-manno-octulosonic-acid transferase
VSLLVLVRGFRARAYWHGWRERFGAGPSQSGGGIWIHAVSVGEVQAALILIEALHRASATTELTLTCATPTGRARARAALSYGCIGYAPYDLPGALRRFMRRVRPRLLIVIETELWPNMLHEARRAGVPCLIASARVSVRTADFYRRLPGLLHSALASNVWVAAQTEADAKRFEGLGVPGERAQTTGNIKFDRSIDPAVLERGLAWRAGLAPARPVWIAGSTHPGEESVVLEAHRLIRAALPDALLILAPRHPQRFDSVADGLAAGDLSSVRRSRSESPSQAAVLLLDSLGELVEFYAAADVAFVGGSLVAIGGHNLLEPAAVGRPVVTGPHQFNSPQVAQALTAQGALTIVHDATELAGAVVRLLVEPAARTAQSAAACRAIAANEGALSRVMTLIERLRDANPAVTGGAVAGGQ